MSGYSQKERRLQAAEQAANWLLTLQSADVSDTQRAEFIDWLRESPLHVAELLHACRLQRDLSGFSKWNEIQAQDWQEAQVVSLPPRVRGSPVSMARRFMGQRAIVAAASVAVIAALSAVIVVHLEQTVIGTQWGERREVTLADGSIVELAPDSEVRVRLKPAVRLVSLDRGEALFHVAKNSKRPFIVTAENTSVRAVGTAFDVARRRGGVAVTVVEGRVSVTTETSPAPSAVATGSLVPKTGTQLTAAPIALSLEADQQVVISSSTGDATPVRQVQSEAEVAWVTDQLNFDNEPVAEVATRFNRYNRTQIKVNDQTLAARRVSGSFRANDPESFVAFIRSVAGATVAHKDTDVIVLGPPPARADASRR
jgi:transmembrane sensor